ncbi:MAG: hypothetical protein ISR65_20120 [Bacteriovoracaceae bacterium]|nr:hypothetical protein [Bacteriovoracaceae bacterium]
MGTTTLNGIAHPILGEIDYKGLFHSKVDKRERIPSNLMNTTHNERKFIRDGYDDHFYGEVDGKFLMLSTSPRFGRLPIFRLTFHQSHFGSAFEIFILFERIWGSDFLYYLIAVCTVHRIDFYRDLKRSYHFVSRTVIRPGSQWSREMMGRRLSFYFGKLAHNSYQFIVYQKVIDGEEYTRIEGRFTGSKVPIKHYIDIVDLKNFNPFSKVNFFHFSKKRMGSDLSLTTKQDLAVKNFNRFYRQYGYQGAYKLLNKDNNFNSSVLPYISTGLKKYGAFQVWRSDVFLPFIQGIRTGSYGFKLTGRSGHEILQEGSAS